MLDLDPDEAEPISVKNCTTPGFNRDDPTNHNRKGHPRDWVNYFNDDAERWFLEEAGDELSDLGYSSRAVGSTDSGRATRRFSPKLRKGRRTEIDEIVGGPNGGEPGTEVKLVRQSDGLSPAALGVARAGSSGAPDTPILQENWSATDHSR